MTRKIQRPKQADVAQLAAAMRQGPVRGAGRRSALYLWLRDNHDALAVTFAQSGPNWASVAAYLGECGILDGDAKPPTARGARNAWGRVRKDVAKARAAMAPAAAEASPAVAQAAAKLPRSRFGTARLRGHSVAPSSPEPKAASPAPVAQDPDAVIARLIGPSTRSRFKPSE